MNHTLQTGNKTGRIHLLDELRGFALLCMIFYHAFYTMFMLFHMEIGARLIRFFMPTEPFFAGVFVLISGISSHLSKNNWSRGGKLLAVSMLITAVTMGYDYFFHAGTTIIFGILHMLALSILIYQAVHKLLNKVPVLLGFCIFILLFLITFHIYHGYLGWGDWHINLPAAWFQTNHFFMFGIVNDSFYSADYFPLIPWLFLFLAGTFLGRWAKDGRFPQWTMRSRIPFLQWLGRHSLVIYIFHQPVIYAILLLLSAFMDQ